MYTGDHVHRRICSTCGNTLTPPGEGGCWVCWHGLDRGILVKDDEIGVWVHQSCLDWFGVDNVVQYEARHYDI